MVVAVAILCSLFIGAMIGVLFMGIVISGKFEDQNNHRNK
jgi:nitrogen fixation-related uncharacterized protein